MNENEEVFEEGFNDDSGSNCFKCGRECPDETLMPVYDETMKMLLEEENEDQESDADTIYICKDCWDSLQGQLIEDQKD